MDDLKTRFHDDKKIIKEVIKDKKIEVDVNTKVDEFVELLNNDKRVQNIVESWCIKLVFKSLMEKAEVKEKERQKEEHKKLKKLEQAFVSMLKKYDVNESTKFDEIKDKIAKEEAYTNVGEVKECERIFNDFISQLNETCLHHVKKKKDKKKSSHNGKRSRSGSEDEDVTKREEGELPGVNAATSSSARHSDDEDEGEIKPSKSSKKRDEDHEEGEVQKSSRKHHKKSKKRKRQKSVSL